MRYFILTKGKMADNGEIVPRSQKTTENDSTTPTCSKTLVVSLNNIINPAAKTGTPLAPLQQKMSDVSANNRVSVCNVILDQPTGLQRALLAGVGKDKIPESLQILTPLAASNTETVTEEIMTEVLAEEQVDTEEYNFPIVESGLVAENMEIANDTSETEVEASEKEPPEAEKAICESEKECSDAAEEEPSETMEVEIGPQTTPLGEPSDGCAAKESTLMNIKGLKIEELLHEDQLDKINSSADTHIVCEDGHVPFHRYILMAASSWINEILINEDPSELAVIHIPDAKVANVVQVLCILYSGQALYKKSDAGHIYKIFQMLGVGTEGLQFRNSKPEDGRILRTLRFYEKELQSEEEKFIPNNLARGNPEIPMVEVEANVENEAGVELNNWIEEHIVPYDDVEEIQGPTVISKEPQRRERKRGQKNRGKKRGAKRKAAIQILHVRKEDEGDQNPEENDGQLEVEVPTEQEVVEIEEEDDDVIFEKEVIHPPNSKKPRCEPSTSSAAGSSETMMHSGKAVVIQDLEELEEIEYVIENDPSGCCKDISAVPVQDLRLLLATCPVCKKRYIKMKTASKCLRTHGLRRCWICLKLVPSNRQDFLQNNLKHIIPGTEGKVSCSFCRKQFGYNIGINTHMGNYHFSRFLETTTKDLDKTKTLIAKQMKTFETLNRGANEKVPKHTYSIATNEQNMNIEEIIINEDSEEVETSSSDGDDPDFVPTDSDLELVSNDDEDRKDEKRQPKSRHSHTADQRRANIPSTPATATTSSTSGQNPLLVKPPQPELGRILLESKEIGGQIYNIYGLINPTSTDPKNKFSKVIAIRNTDVQARANLKLKIKQIKQKQQINKTRRMPYKQLRVTLMGENV